MLSGIVLQPRRMFMMENYEKVIMMESYFWNN